MTWPFLRSFPHLIYSDSSLMATARPPPLAGKAGDMAGGGGCFFGGMLLPRQAGLHYLGRSSWRVVWPGLAAASWQTPFFSAQLAGRGPRALPGLPASREILVLIRGNDSELSGGLEGQAHTSFPPTPPSCPCHICPLCGAGLCSRCKGARLQPGLAGASGPLYPITAIKTSPCFDPCLGPPGPGSASPAEI